MSADLIYETDEELEYDPPWGDGCASCHVPRETGDGRSYSYAALGVLCPSCEGADYAEELAYLRANMTAEERIAERWSIATFRLERVIRPGGYDPEEPPF